MNQFIIPIIMIVADIFAIPIVIKLLMKKYSENPGKLRTMIIVFISVIVITDAVSIGVSVTRGIKFDREAVLYTQGEDVVYYDRDGDKYTLKEINSKQYFVNSQESRMMFAQRVYVDMDGYIVLDAGNTFKPESDGSYSDSDGNKYYPALEVKWNSKGEMQLCEQS